MMTLSASATATLISMGRTGLRAGVVSITTTTTRFETTPAGPS